MSFTFDDPTGYSAAARKIQDEIARVSEVILSGRVDDWTEHQHLMGKLIGLRLALEILTNKPQQQASDEDGSTG